MCYIIMLPASWDYNSHHRCGRCYHCHWVYRGYLIQKCIHSGKDHYCRIMRKKKKNQQVVINCQENIETNLRYSQGEEFCCCWCIYSNVTQQMTISWKLHCDLEIMGSANISKYHFFNIKKYAYWLKFLRKSHVRGISTQSTTEHHEILRGFKEQ